jgi:fibronectin type 3 domain-containing protein
MGDEGSYNILQSGYIEVTTLFDAPASLITTSMTGAVSLSWTAPSNIGGSNLETYAIWRATTPFIATTSATLIASIATTSTSYSDTSVVLRTTYYYRVTATNASATSSLSNQRVSNANSGRIIRLGGVRLR